MVLTSAYSRDYYDDTKKLAKSISSFALSPGCIIITTATYQVARGFIYNLRWNSNWKVEKTPLQRGKVYRCLNIASFFFLIKKIHFSIIVSVIDNGVWILIP